MFTFSVFGTIIINNKYNDAKPVNTGLPGLYLVEWCWINSIGSDNRVSCFAISQISCGSQITNGLKASNPVYIKVRIEFGDYKLRNSALYIK